MIKRTNESKSADNNCYAVRVVLNTIELAAGNVQLLIKLYI